MTTPPSYPEQLLAQTAWLQRLARELVPNAHSAADLAQDTLAAALERPQPTRANVKTWLGRIARNLAAGRTRSHFRRLRREQAAVRTVEEPATADTLAQFEMHRSVVDAVQALREPIRTTLLLRFWEDLPPREIGERMNAPVETVRTRIRRGLEELRGNLDAKHGRRQTWSMALLAHSTGRGAVMAPASFTAAAVTILMQTKTLAFAAIAIVGIAAALSWNASTRTGPDVTPSANTPPTAPGTGSAVNPPDRQAAAESHSTTTAERTLAVADPTAGTAWFTGTVSDATASPIANVEVALLSKSGADKYGHHIMPRPTGRDLQLLRTRWALWHISDNGLMQKRSILSEVFGSQLVTRTEQHGCFRFRQDSVAVGMTLVVWSPEVGLRFRDITAPRLPHQIVCENWPRIRGHVRSTTGNRIGTARVTVDYGDRGSRVLQFETAASGEYATPPIPPDHHTVGFQAEGHHRKRERFALVDDVTLATELTPLAQLRARLVDAAGQLLDRQQLDARGWAAEELRFLLLREDFQNESTLSAELRSPSALLYSPEDGSVQGTVADPQALVLSVWRGRERIAATLLPGHQVTEVAIDIPGPKPATTLEVNVAVNVAGGGKDPGPIVHLELGTMVGLGGYNFHRASSAEGPPDRFRINAPGHLRSQICRLVVTAPGYATQFVEVAIPDSGAPQPVWLTLLPANLALIGRVVDEHDQPLLGARVKIANVEGRAFRILPNSITATDAAGEFRFDHLAAGNVRLFVSGREFASTSALATVGSTTSEATVTIRGLPGVERTIDLGPAAGRGVALRILDAAGAPLMDDRLFGAMHGRVTRIRVSRQAHRLEAWPVRASKPAVTIDLR